MINPRNPVQPALPTTGLGRQVKRALALTFAVTMLAAGCGSDEPDDAGSGSTTAPTSNACPSDGCQISIDNVETAGSELLVTWSANFAPDFAKNHIHIYWDNFTAAQVSNDADDRGVEQGDWVPTDSMPTYTTEGVVSLAERGESTRVCVVAADSDHDVLDEETQACTDVADLV